MHFEYKAQEKPRGLADAFIVGADFIGSEPVALLLGDNILYGSGLVEKLHEAAAITSGAVIFAYPVKDPERFGVVVLDEQQKPKSLEEKPLQPKIQLRGTGAVFLR